MTDLSEASQLDRAHALVAEATEALSERSRELERLQWLVELLLEAAPPVMVLERGTVRAWSAAAERLTGLSASEVIGRRGSLLPLELGPPLAAVEELEVRVLERSTRSHQSGSAEAVA